MIRHISSAVVRRPLRRSRSLLASAIVGIACLGLAGCADMVTYSKDSRREGVELYNRGAYADSAGAFRNAVRQNPRDYRSYYYLGASNEQLGQFQQAIAAYKTSYSVITTTMEGKQDTAFRVRVMNGLASAIAKSDTREVELNALEQRARTRSIPDDWYTLGRIYAIRGDADGAIEALTRAATIDPNNYHFARDAGLYLEQVGQTAQAVPLLRRAYGLSGGEDQQVAAALRRMGVIPGPSLKDESQLADPIVPKGPIPSIAFPPQPGSVAGTPADQPIRD
jgi:tetratricopeptide (TPR) repeat protein